MDTSDPTNRRRLHFFVIQFQLDVAACHVSVTEPLLHHCDIVLEKDCFIPITKKLPTLLVSGYEVFVFVWSSFAKTDKSHSKK